MVKFSIIIPVYNVEQYIEKCLDSVFNQTYKNFEVIVVNDGTEDNSIDIIKKYDVKLINQKNQGLSAARNNGVKEATGEYLIFVDSDDYIEKDLLEQINNNLENNPTIVRYQAIDVIEKREINRYEEEFYNKNGKDAFSAITEYHYVEPAWLYAINRKYYLENNFEFKTGAYHEDFGLIPLVIYKSEKVNSINYCGYCYLKRTGSIMNTTSYEKDIKKMDDMLIHYNYLMNEISKIKGDNKIIVSFISNSVIMKLLSLKKDDYKKYLKVLRDKKVFDNLLDNTLPRRIKKMLIKISPKLFYRIKGNDIYE